MPSSWPFVAFLLSSERLGSLRAVREPRRASEAKGKATEVCFRVLVWPAIPVVLFQVNERLSVGEPQAAVSRFPLPNSWDS